MATTFDIEQVRRYAADVNSRLDRCETGEGMECDSLDATLTFCATCCCEFTQELRQWANDVFSGKVIFDRAAEQLWKAELLGLQERAIKLRGIGEMREKTCFSLEGKTRLEAALWGLDRLSRNWVTPKLSVGPAARVTLNAAIVAEARKKIAELKPLPHDWKPQNQQQETLLNRD